jgi:hypothetical protein
MRLLFHICCIAAVAGASPVFSQDAVQFESPTPAAGVNLPRPATGLPPRRVGRVKLVSGDVDLRRRDETGWINAGPNQPIFAGDSVRTDPHARSEIRVGANAVHLSNDTELTFGNLREQFFQIILSRGRIELQLRHIGDSETVEVDLPRAGVWLLGPGVYDIDASGGDQPSRVAVFEGKAHLVDAGSDTRIEANQAAILAGSQAVAAAIQAAVPDAFTEWCHERDYDVRSLAASYTSLRT